MKSASSPIEQLLQIPADSALMDRWLAVLPRSKGTPVKEEGRFQILYDALLTEYWKNPRRALNGVLHARQALGSSWSPRERALFLRMEANTRIGVGDLEGAIRDFDRAYRSFARTGDRREQGRTTIGWLYALGLRGDANEANRVARLGRRLLPKTSPADRARLEANLGNALLHAGRLRTADQRFLDALTRFRRLKLHGEAGVCLLNLGMNAWLRAEVTASRRLLLDAAERLRAAGNTVLALYAETGLCAIELVADGRPASWKQVHVLREKFKEVGDERALAWSHQELASLLMSIGAFEAAAPEAEAAWSIFSRCGFRDEAARAAVLRARVASSMEGHQLALSLLEGARRHWKEARCAWAAQRVELEQGRLALKNGDARRAHQILRPLYRRLQRARTYDAHTARTLMAETYFSLGFYGYAIALARRAHHEARRHPARWDRPRLALLIARVLAQQNRSRDAVVWAKRAAQDLEMILFRFGERRLRLLLGESRTRLYGEAIEIVLRHGGKNAVDGALDLVSKARSPNLVEDLRGRDRGTNRALRSALARLRDQLLGTEEDRREHRSHGMSRELDTLSLRLERSMPRTKSSLQRAWEERRFESWKHRLAGRQLVFFDRNQKHWRAFFVDATLRSSVIELPDLENAIHDSWIPLRLLFDAAAQLPPLDRAKFLDKTEMECVRGLDSLRASLWHPIPLDLGSRVVVIPAGELHALPLEAMLQLERDALPEVTRLPHPVLLPPRKASPRLRNALLLHGQESGTAQEVADVSRHLQNEGWQVRVGCSRGDLENLPEKIGLLHVAAHGSFHREGWLLSGLCLSDGWIGFEHLPRGRIRGALLSFTSCESGRSNLFPGSDLDGWMTAGFAAGARDLALTLWKVDDASAQAFAGAFFRNWTQGASTAAASAAARREIRARWKHPYHWAPFFSVA